MMSITRLMSIGVPESLAATSLSEEIESALPARYGWTGPLGLTE